MRLETIDRAGTMQGFVLVKSCERKNAKNGSVYLDLTITDGEDDLNAKIWDFKGTPAEQPQPNTLIRVRGTVSTYNSQTQFKIDRYRFVIPEDNVNIGDFVPSAKYSGDYMFDAITSLVSSFEDAELKKLTFAVLKDYKDRIFDLPAASRLHHAVRGGLLMHTLSICRMAECVASLYPSVDRDLLVCGAILHDVAKADEFNLSPTGLVESYSVSGMLVGHLVKGAMIVDEIGKREGIDPAVLVLVQHMLISHHGKPEYGAAVRPCFLEAEILSTLDTLDADIYEIENAVKGVEPGGFSNKLWALDDRKFFNHGRKNTVTEVNL